MKKYLILIFLLAITFACSVSTPKPSLPTQTIEPITPAISPSPQPTKKPVLCSVTASTLNLRQGPGTENKIIAWLDYETVLEVNRTTGNWYKVASPSGEVGYVHSKYCKIKRGKK